MNYGELDRLKSKPFFGTEDVAKLLGIKPQSAQVLCSRYAKKGYIVRLKKDFYVLKQAWENFSREDFFKIANFLQVPSYISFMSALAFYGVSTQTQRDFFESASLKRSIQLKAKGAEFNFYKLKRELYSGFEKREGVFIASREKAFIDAVYLYSFGKYRLDFDSLDMDRLDKREIAKLIAIYPQKTQNIAKRLCRI